MGLIITLEVHNGEVERSVQTAMNLQAQDDPDVVLLNYSLVG